MPQRLGELLRRQPRGFDQAGTGRNGGCRDGAVPAGGHVIGGRGGRHDEDLCDEGGESEDGGAGHGDGSDWGCSKH